MQNDSRRLQIDRPGLLDELRIRTVDRRRPRSSEIEVEVRSAGLNFRDVLVALDMYPGKTGLLGLECAGVVVARGSAVREFEVGDAVLGLCSGGAFADYVTELADFFVTKPDWLSFEEAATIPVTFLTGYYALTYLGRMTQGDRVLIHSAAGGVGLAALQLARNAGAEVFATVSTPEKVALMNKLGVQYTMNSRSYEFSDQIKRVTDDEGVDLVLNSLAREFIPRSISLLRARGRYLEIGKKDLMSYTQVYELNPDVSYFIIDLVDLAEQQPDLIRAMLLRLMDDFRAKKLRALPLENFDFEEDGAQDAFRYMTRGKHIGKIVISQTAAA